VFVCGKEEKLVVFLLNFGHWNIVEMVLHVFVTVGTTKFDDLINELVRQKDVFEDIRAVVRIQMGGSDLKESIPDWEVYKYKPSLKEDMEWADVIISHAGSGSIIEILRMRKICLVVINETLMDNHQMELAYELDRKGYLMACKVKELRDYLYQCLVQKHEFEPFPSSSGNFLSLLNDLSGYTCFEQSLKKN
jgi:beta-1,4-N-acetylglucosaminyltransferase